jgi:putative ABC transport system permease protein
MILFDYARLATRASRRSLGRMALVVVCIALGVASIVAVAGLAAAIDQGMRAEGRKLLAGDVAVEGWRPIPAELDGILAEVAGGGAVRRADIHQFASVVLGPRAAASQLCEIKVISGAYPFYGELRLDPDRPIADLLAPDAAVVAPELLTRLGARAGDELTIGGARFRVAATIEEEPDKLSATFAIGPRVFLSPAGVARTSLLDRGARIEHRALLKLADAATSADATRLAERVRARLPGAEMFRVRTFEEAQPALRRSAARVGDYLGLVGLLSLLVGGVGVAQVSRAWLAARMDDIAVLRCIGATPVEVIAIYAAQVLAVALAASVLGAALGTALHAAVPKLVAGILPPELIHPVQPAAIGRGILLGLCAALLFTIPALLGLGRVPPVRVLLRDAEPTPLPVALRAATALVVVAGVWAAAALESRSAMRGGFFALGLVLVVGVLTAIALATSALARAVPRGAGAASVRVRHGLAHLARPGAESVGSIVALGLGVTFVFATHLVERHLVDQLRAELPPEAPTTFFMDVQPDQWPGLRAAMEREGATSIDQSPVVTARFTALDSVPVSELAARASEDDPLPARRGSDTRMGVGEQPRRWALTREQRLTYGPALPRGNRVIAGAFPSALSPSETRGGVSLEESFARDLGVRVGSTVSLDVQGVPIDLVVTSIRTVDWRTFGINFFLFAEPGPLDAAPQQRLAVARFPQADLAGVGARIVRAYPNVTLLHVRDVVEKVLAVLGSLSSAVRALGFILVVVGAIVLAGTVTATETRRSREVALLKTVGMTTRDVVAVFAIEYALTGAVAALVGLGAGSALAWVVIAKLLQLAWLPRAMELGVGAGAVVVMAVVAGVAASARALSAPPATVLRSE